MPRARPSHLASRSRHHRRLTRALRTLPESQPIVEIDAFLSRFISTA
jgi:hypothetical protein